MWNNKIKKISIIIASVLVVGAVFFGSIFGSRIANAASASPSQSHSTSANNGATANTSTFRVTGIDMSVTPGTTTTWTCGSYIQVVYHAVFHVDSGPNGGTLEFAYTVNNGRSQMPEKLTILPGQRLTDFTFTWQGNLSSDHVYPGPGGIIVTSPNNLVSKMVAPTGYCR